MSRNSEQTNLLADRIATVAAILRLGEQMGVLARVVAKDVTPLRHIASDDELCYRADDLLNAAAEYLERRDARERAENRASESPSEPGAMPKNTGKHPENLEKTDDDPLHERRPTAAELFDQLDALLAIPVPVRDVMIARTTVDLLRRRFAELDRQDASFAAVTPELVGAVAKAFWAEFEGVPWDAARFLKSERYASAAVQAIKAARAVARGNTVTGQKSPEPDPSTFIGLRALVYQLIGSLTLSDHMRDVAGDVETFLQRAGDKVEWSEWDDLRRALGRRGVTTLYGTPLAEGDELDEDGGWPET